MATPIPDNRAAFTVTEVVVATGGSVRGDPAQRLEGVVTDSRRAFPGSLFVALRGERFDGHQFVDDVLQRGAGAVLVERGTRVPTAAVASVIEVADTTRALGDLARAQRLRWGGTVVAITGSAGKTTTKELTAAALGSDGGAVLRTAGNLNNQIGVPMTLFGLDATVKTAVIELGTNAPGEIARLSDISRPDVGVVTLAAAAHTEGLGTVARVAEEKAALLLALGENGIAVANGDVSALAPWLSRVRARTVWRYGKNSNADLQLLSFGIDDTLHTRCAFRVTKTGRALSGTLALLGEGAALNAAAALSVALLLGRSPEKAMRAMEEVAPTEGRMLARTGKLGSLVIDDSYNANPRSMDIAIETASAVARRKGRRLVAVLGAMKELGEEARAHHLLVAERLSAEGVAVFVGCGEEMRPVVELSKQLGVAEALWTKDSSEALDAVSGLLAEGDVVLVKGSRSFAMERVVAGLAAGERSA